jgi:putative SOS response-associated peptidase YedK
LAGPENRCLVPFTAFSEPETLPDGKKRVAWFALSEERPLGFFAGIWIPQWKSVRKVKEGETTNDLFAVLTCEPNAEVANIHPKAMPVILQNEEEYESWFSVPTTEALKLQRPLPDRSLVIV